MDDNFLASRVLKACYFPNSSPLEAKKLFQSSYTWTNIASTNDLVEEGISWRIGNDDAVKIWSNRSIPNNLILTEESVAP